jgi:hypothetical protein
LLHKETVLEKGKGLIRQGTEQTLNMIPITIVAYAAAFIYLFIPFFLLLLFLSFRLSLGREGKEGKQNTNALERIDLDFLD